MSKNGKNAGAINQPSSTNHRAGEPWDSGREDDPDRDHEAHEEPDPLQLANMPTDVDDLPIPDATNTTEDSRHTLTDAGYFPLTPGNTFRGYILRKVLRPSEQYGKDEIVRDGEGRPRVDKVTGEVQIVKGQWEYECRGTMTILDREGRTCECRGNIRIQVYERLKAPLEGLVGTRRAVLVQYVGQQGDKPKRGDAGQKRSGAHLFHVVPLNLVTS